MSRKHITIYDIAREAEVSPATVSRILNGSSRVKEENRRRVNALIEKYNFRPNAMARALSDTRSKLIGMVLADANNPYYSSLFSACVNEAYRRGYAVMMFNTLSRPEMEDAALERLREQRADAVIISGGRVDLTVEDEGFAASLHTAAENMNVVLASRSRYPKVHGIEVAHASSVDLAMDYLLGLGHRDIGFIYTGEQFYGTAEKLERFRERMAQAGLKVNEQWMISVGEYNCESGHEGVDRLMQLPERPTALLGLNDMITAGALQGLLDHGVRVPEEISLMGFDDTFITSITSPQLTAIHYDYAEYARMLVDAATGPIEEREIPWNQTLECRLLKRRSCCEPARNP